MPTPCKKPFVLLVHPDPVTCRIVSAELGDEFSFLCASTGEQAERLYLAHRPDVLAVDDGVTDTTPRALVEALREVDPELHAVFLVDRRPDSVVWRLAELGTVLANRTDLERLRAAIGKEARAHEADRLRGGRGAERAEGATRRDAPDSRRKSTDE